MQLWNQNPTLCVPSQGGYALTVSDSLLSIQKEPSFCQAYTAAFRGQFTLYINSDLEKSLHHHHKNITPVPATVFPSAQMHFLSILSSSQKAAALKPFPAGTVNTTKIPRDRDTSHVKTWAEAYFCPPRTGQWVSDLLAHDTEVSWKPILTLFASGCLYQQSSSSNPSCIMCCLLRKGRFPATHLLGNPTGF